MRSRPHTCLARPWAELSCLSWHFNPFLYVKKLIKTKLIRVTNLQMTDADRRESIWRVRGVLPLSHLPMGKGSGYMLYCSPSQGEDPGSCRVARLYLTDDISQRRRGLDWSFCELVRWGYLSKQQSLFQTSSRVHEAGMDFGDEEGADPDRKALNLQVGLGSKKFEIYKTSQKWPFGRPCGRLNILKCPSSA